MHPLRRWYQQIIKKMLYPPCRRLPSRPPLRLPVSPFHIVIISGLRLPRTICLRIKRPIRQVNPMQPIRHRLVPQISRSPKMRPIPSSDVLSNLRLRDLKRHQPHRLHRRPRILHIQQRRRSAKITSLRHPRRIKHRHRLATLTPHRLLHRLPTTLIRTQRLQRTHQVLLHHQTPIRLQLRRRLRPAVRTHQSPLRRRPHRLSPARRAGKLLNRGQLGGFSHGNEAPKLPHLHTNSTPTACTSTPIPLHRPPSPLLFPP